MKQKIIGLGMTLLLFSGALMAQDETDALRYSLITDGGTARAQAIGGAMGSVGGDISSLSDNPAGIGYFRTNEFSFSPGFNSLSNNSSYYNSPGQDSRSNLFLQSGGFIFAGDNRNSGPGKWENLTFGIGFNRLANFNNNIYYQGTISNPNNYSSYSDNYLIDLANNNVTSVSAAQSNYPFGVSEAVNAGLIGPIQDSLGNFQGWTSLPSQILANGLPLLQSNTVSTQGGLDEISFGVAGNYSNKLYLGASLNIPSINYIRDETFRETNNQDPSSVLNHYDVENYLQTTGSGINGKIGAIFSPVPMFRLGLAFHTPSYFTMHDTYYTTVTTNTKDQGVVSSTTSQVTGGYNGDYQYSLTTPLRLIASGTLIFGAGKQDISNQMKGFVTAEAEFINYGAARFHFNQGSSSDISYQNSLNTSISTIYKGTANFRLGGELKVNIWSFRLGMNYLGDPYQDHSIPFSNTRFSGGIGIRTGGFYIDLTYLYTRLKHENQPYLVQQNSLNIPSPQAALLNASSNQVLSTIGFKF